MRIIVVVVVIILVLCASVVVRWARRKQSPAVGGDAERPLTMAERRALISGLVGEQATKVKEGKPLVARTPSAIAQEKKAAERSIQLGAEERLKNAKTPEERTAIELEIALALTAIQADRIRPICGTCAAYHTAGHPELSTGEQAEPGPPPEAPEAPPMFDGGAGEPGPPPGALKAPPTLDAPERPLTMAERRALISGLVGEQATKVKEGKPLVARTPSAIAQEKKAAERSIQLGAEERLKNAKTPEERAAIELEIALALTAIQADRIRPICGTCAAYHTAGHPESHADLEGSANARLLAQFGALFAPSINEAAPAAILPSSVALAVAPASTGAPMTMPTPAPIVTPGEIAMPRATTMLTAVDAARGVMSPAWRPDTPPTTASAPPPTVSAPPSTVSAPPSTASVSAIVAPSLTSVPAAALPVAESRPLTASERLIRPPHRANALHVIRNANDVPTLETQPSIIIGESVGALGHILESMPKRPATLYYLVPDTPGKLAPLLRAATTDLRYETTDTAPVAAADMAAGATGRLYKIVNPDSPDYYTQFVDYVRPTLYASSS